MNDFLERLRAAWNILRKRQIRLDSVAVSGSTMTKVHACIFTMPDGSYELLDNCKEQCDAQEAYLMGGEIWERYAMEIHQRAGPTGIDRKKR